MKKSTFCIEFLDFDTKKKINNVKAEIKNIENKNIDIYQVINGRVSISIDDKNLCDFYHICLIMNDGSKQSPYFLAKTPQVVDEKMVEVDVLHKVVSPNSYTKHSLKLYFKQYSNTKTDQIGVIKAYKTYNNIQKVYYDYQADSKDEIFVASKNQVVAFQAYFYRDLEAGKRLSQKKHKILSNEYVKSYVNADKILWHIDDKIFYGNPIFVNLNDINLERKSTLAIMATHSTNNLSKYKLASKVHYRETFKADGSLFKEKSHLVVDALAEMNLALEEQYTFVQDYRGLFLCENRHEIGKLETNTTQNFKLRDYIDSQTKYNTKITHNTDNIFFVNILDNKQSIAMLRVACDNNTKSILRKKQNIPFIYHQPTKYVIHIVRYVQTTKYTLSNYEILEKQENGAYKKLEEQIASGVILEPCGPDGLLADTMLRIPQGHYKIQKHITGPGLREYMYKGKLTNELPKLYDGEFVLRGKHDIKRTNILIHSGTNILESPLDRTEGCLLIGSIFDNAEFSERLITHGKQKIDIVSEQDVLKRAAKEKKNELYNIENQKFNKEYKNKEIDKLNKKLYIKYGKNYKENVEPYINASIRMLVEFIQKYGYSNFSIHIKNDFSKG